MFISNRDCVSHNYMLKGVIPNLSENKTMNKNYVQLALMDTGLDMAQTRVIFQTTTIYTLRHLEILLINYKTL